MHHMRKTKTQFVKNELLVEVFLILWWTNSLSKCICQDITLLAREQKLYKRLNPDGTPKEWSIQINRVDNAAYHHDLCYSKHDDTKTWNEVCDKTMLGELNGIVNPTLRERIDKSIVGKLTKAKVNFGLGAHIKKTKNLLMNLQRNSINQSI